jgi:hypothetical protein
MCPCRAALEQRGEAALTGDRGLISSGLLAAFGALGSAFCGPSFFSGGGILPDANSGLASRVFAGLPNRTVTPPSSG